MSSHWRTMPRKLLFSTNIFTGMRFAATVASSWMFIWKLPSPSISTNGLSGLANQAPMAAGRPKPMVPSPPELIHCRGREKR
jgi:hypothetical protein